MIVDFRFYLNSNKIIRFGAISSQNTSETTAKELLAPKTPLKRSLIVVQQFAVKIPINSDNFPTINFPVSLQHRTSHSAYNDKVNKYQRACNTNGVSFLPFIMDSNGFIPNFQVISRRFSKASFLLSSYT